MSFKSFVKGLLIPAICCVLLPACSDALDDKGIAEHSGITVAEAADVFQQKIKDYEILRSKVNIPVNDLLPANYTPQWKNAVTGENEYIWSIEAPIISSRRLLAASNPDDKKPWKAAVTQKVVIIKNKKTKQTEMFVLSLIPDRECFGRYRNHLRRGRTYTHAGDTRNFSGTAVYTLWEGTNVAVNRHDSTGIKETFRYSREKSSPVQKVISENAIGSSGDYVLRSDDPMPCPPPCYTIEEGTVIGIRPRCYWCGNYTSECICDEDPGHGGGGDDYDPPAYSCPWCGDENCYGQCQDTGGGSGQGGEGDTSDPPAPPTPPENVYDKWDMDEKTKDELKDAFDSLYDDCLGKILMDAAPDSFKVVYDASISNLMHYDRTRKIIAWNMYTDEGIFMNGLFEEFFHVYQSENDRFDIGPAVNGVKPIRNLINLEVEAKLAAYQYTLAHGIDETTNEHSTFWNDDEKKILDKYLKNPTKRNYNKLVDWVSNMSEYKGWQNRVLPEYNNTNFLKEAIDINNCDKYKYKK